MRWLCAQLALVVLLPLIFEIQKDVNKGNVSLYGFHEVPE